MKPLILLAATSLSALVALPNMPDLATIQKGADALLASGPTQLSTLSQPAQPEQTVQADPVNQAPQVSQPDPAFQAQAQAQDGTTASASSSAEEPFVAQATPNQVRQSYGEPQRVEHNNYGETWYYPVYIVYFRNGFVHRVPRTTRYTPPTTVQSASSAVATNFVPQAPAQSWRFANHSSLGTVSLNGAGVQRTSNYVPRQASGVPTVATATTRTSFRSGGTYSTGGGSATGNCYRPTSTASVSRPVAPRSVPVSTGSAYARPAGY